MILDNRLSLRKTAAPTPSTSALASGSGSASTSNENTHHDTEKPPPYIAQEGGSHTQPRPPPLPERPLPTFPTLRPSHSVPKLPSASSTFAEYLDPPPTVNQVHLNSKKEDIIGTFYVDPLIPSLNPKRKKHGKRGTPQPTASFHTRSGNISLALATTGNIRAAPKATVGVSSRCGNIELRLLPTPSTRPRIGLDTCSRSGNVTLWLPETFSGVIQLNTQKGELHVLPNLLKTVKVLKETDKEAILLMGTESAGADLTDLCQLTTRSGKIILGLSGLDKHPEKTGFWKKLSLFLRG